MKKLLPLFVITVMIVGCTDPHFVHPKAITTDQMLIDNSMTEWWDTFHYMQEQGADMYTAASYANAARLDAYWGCRNGCKNCDCPPLQQDQKD